MAMFRSLVASAQQRAPPGGPAGGDGGLEAQFSCPICLEVYHRPVAIGGCGHTRCGARVGCGPLPPPRQPAPLGAEAGARGRGSRGVAAPTSALASGGKPGSGGPSVAQCPRPQVLRGVPPAVPAGDVPSVPTLPPALRPQEGGQGRPRGEAALGLQGALPGLQQKGGAGQDEGARSLLREDPGADGQLPQVRPRGAHFPAHPQRRPQQVHLHLPLLRRPQPGPAGAPATLRGQSPQRPQPRGVPRLLGHALGGPQLQERQLPAAPAPPAQVLLRHIRGLQHRRGGRLPGRPGLVPLGELKDHRHLHPSVGPSPVRAPGQERGARRAESPRCLVWGSPAGTARDVGQLTPVLRARVRLLWPRHFRTFPPASAPVSRFRAETAVRV